MMALTGICLVLFVTFHVLMNAVALIWPSAYNVICQFLGANWYALIACYGLGYTAAMLIAAGVTGYMSSLRNLTFAPVNCVAGGIPITMMMNMERRHGHMKPVIRKALVELDGAPFLKFVKERENWKIGTCYTYPGPIQYFGPAEVCDQPSLTLVYEQKRRKY